MKHHMRFQGDKNEFDASNRCKGKPSSFRCPENTLVTGMPLSEWSTSAEKSFAERASDFDDIFEPFANEPKGTNKVDKAS